MADIIKKPASINLASMAPKGIDPNAWLKVLKDQLLSSKNDDPSDVELMYFAQVCQSTGLDPSRREIYGIYRNVKDKRSGRWEPKLTIQTGIDGFRTVAERSGKYAGSKDYVFEYDESKVISFTMPDGSQKIVPNRATCTVIKLMGNMLVETTRSVKWEDYYPGHDMGAMWRKLPETMLGKCAEAQALRAAFPNTAQLYLAEEMAQADGDPDVKEVAEKVDEAIEAIKNAKTADDVKAALETLGVDEQRQVTDLATRKLTELELDKNEQQ